MTSEEKREYVKYQVEKAYHTYNTAKILADNGYWNSSTNRLNYSLFSP